MITIVDYLDRLLKFGVTSELDEAMNQYLNDNEETVKYIEVVNGSVEVHFNEKSKWWPSIKVMSMPIKAFITIVKRKV